ncbi:MAG: hypothetical protein JOZ62_16910 [Acidobacteriaceae bacterium]|nr:hypothetical protein [Acidobacteriaceae bacterium]
MKQWNSVLAPVVVMSLIISPAMAFAQSSELQWNTCGNGTISYQLHWDSGAVRSYMDLFPPGSDQPGITPVWWDGSDTVVEDLATGNVSPQGAGTPPPVDIPTFVIASKVVNGQVITEVFQGTTVLVQAPSLRAYGRTLAGGVFRLSAKGANALAFQRAWAVDWIERHFVCFRLSYAVNALTWVFAAAVILAYATPAIAQQLLPITTARLQDFRTDCQKIFDYIKKIDIDHPYTTAGSCADCYNTAYSGATSAPSSADITTCAADMTNQNAAYNQMKELIGELNEKAGTACAGKAGGYYTMPFTGPPLWADRPNVTPIERICPYR